MRVLAVLFGLAFAAIGVLFLLWILWRLWQQHEEDVASPVIRAEVPSGIDEPVAEEPEPELDSPTPMPDDLTRIEGIGPKISSVMQAAGITTFTQLASSEVNQIGQILEDADPRLRRLADPTTWPEQAHLAAAGDWEGLTALQSKLRGGRRA
jgi:predicted flap endonuclease-1-like 5' DNA nuclease